MGSLRGKETLTIGLMLFALFFGAGNLIFPPFLGQEAGANFWPAMLGFVVTGVGLPLLTVVVISMAKDGIQEIGSRVHPLFAVVFSAAVYLSIGPFFGIPRSANVAFEMSVKPFMAESGSHPMALLIFTVVFFALVYWVTLNPSKMVERIGSILTPVLLVAIVLLVLGSIFKLDGSFGEVSEKYAVAPFASGFLEGYLTMDTIAALAFGIIVVGAVQQKKTLERKQVVRETLKAGLIAGIGLAFVYITVGLLGAKMASYGTYDNGGTILTEAAKMMFGDLGMLLLGLIVTLACFTTAVGLVAATSQFFAKMMPKVSYKTFTLAVTLVSLLIANLGLNQIISISVPVLIVLYPITIVLVVLSFLDRFFNGSRGVYVGAVFAAAMVSVIDGLKTFGIESDALASLLKSLPLSAEGLGWVLPALVGGLAGWAFDKLILSKDGKKNLKPASE
ncbi:branched-chain amino acid transport system II carrier protein [Mesobacillus subterraneus]|uniref:branched-chain amino acid transport system II carrier protein n=1 Tax=Mesobacillus subterraneus TaxID=285983 RepID=UPI002040AB06|nr:branched-chain amino acid transport system II carrier protein [Mesobacillus subterraneus]MCM3663402.1 branched-chain amino acid transport system II carrier protein [Mesobacillus subterraneus]MCM3683173.1 branched-chain amino acid transport system II carrier protein [Mesobacillus subterraneus]